MLEGQGSIPLEPELRPPSPLVPASHDEISPFTPLARDKRIALLKEYPKHRIIWDPYICGGSLNIPGPLYLRTLVSQDPYIYWSLNIFQHISIGGSILWRKYSRTLVFNILGPLTDIVQGGSEGVRSRSVPKSIRVFEDGERK